MKRNLKSTVLATLVAGTFLYGCAKANVDENTITEIFDRNEPTKSYSSDDAVLIPEQFRSQFLYSSLVTVEELMKLESLDITVDSNLKDSDLAWLNYCTNLKDLTIHTTNCDALKGIKYLPKLTNLNLVADTVDYNTYLTKDNCKFMSNSKYLDTVTIGNYSIEPTLIESLKQVNTLVLNANNDTIVSNYNFDYNKLTSLKHLIVNRPGSFVIHMDQKDVDRLKSNGVTIETNINGGIGDITEYLTGVNKDLDNIMNLYQFNRRDSKEDQVKSVLSYVLNRNEYDFTNIDEDKATIQNIYYQDGFLYGALYGNNIICGNYSALVSALLHRLGIENYLAVDNNHAYNIVNINGKVYYVDSTVLDIKLGHDTISKYDIPLDKKVVDVDTINPIAANYLRSKNYVNGFLASDGIYALIAGAGVIDIYLLNKIRKAKREEKARKVKLKENQANYIRYMNEQMRLQQLKDQQKREQELREQQFRTRQLQNQKISEQRLREQLLREKQSREHVVVGKAYPASARYVENKPRSR